MIQSLDSIIPVEHPSWKEQPPVIEANALSNENATEEQIQRQLDRRKKLLFSLGIDADDIPTVDINRTTFEELCEVMSLTHIDHEEIFNALVADIVF